MKTKTLYACFFIICLLFFYCSKKKEKCILGEIEVPKEINLDTIQPNKEYHKSFLIKNVGTTNLIIKDIKASCDCTVVDEWDSIIRVGDSTNIDIKFTPINLGLFEKSIVIRSNVKDEFSIINLKGFVKDEK